MNIIKLILAYPEGLEPSTCRSVADRSIQLSYGYIPIELQVLSVLLSKNMSHLKRLLRNFFAMLMLYVVIDQIYFII